MHLVFCLLSLVKVSGSILISMQNLWHKLMIPKSLEELCGNKLVSFKWYLLNQKLGSGVFMKDPQVILMLLQKFHWSKIVILSLGYCPPKTWEMSGDIFFETRGKECYLASSVSQKIWPKMLIVLRLRTLLQDMHLETIRRLILTDHCK